MTQVEDFFLLNAFKRSGSILANEKKWYLFHYKNHSINGKVYFCNYNSVICI